MILQLGCSVASYLTCPRPCASSPYTVSTVSPRPAIKGHPSLPIPSHHSPLPHRNPHSTLSLPQFLPENAAAPLWPRARRKNTTIAGFPRAWRADGASPRRPLPPLSAPFCSLSLCRPNTPLCVAQVRRIPSGWEMMRGGHHGEQLPRARRTLPSRTWTCPWTASARRHSAQPSPSPPAAGKPWPSPHLLFRPPPASRRGIARRETTSRACAAWH
jgi:hypothetical protein